MNKFYDIFYSFFLSNTQRKSHHHSSQNYSNNHFFKVVVLLARKKCYRLKGKVTNAFRISSSLFQCLRFSWKMVFIQNILKLSFCKVLIWLFFNFCIISWNKYLNFLWFTKGGHHRPSSIKWFDMYYLPNGKFCSRCYPNEL